MASPIKAGGRPGLTLHLNGLYKNYSIEQQTQGLQALDWPMWLQQNGFRLGDDLLVQPLDSKAVDRLVQINSGY